jgi:hypothetical protein
MLDKKEKLQSFFLKNSLYIVILLTFAFTVYFYSPILFSPSKFLFSDTGDAIKNYFCYDWHIQNDTSYINYTGTNYPYGENHGYTDGNPLLGNFIKTFPFLKSYSIPIFNLSIILSFIVCAIILFKIFQEFKIQPLLAIIASVGITILCPQAFRISGHLALSYDFFIPLTIYLLLLFENRSRKLYYSLLLSFSILCYFFIHPYLGMISSSFVFIYMLLKLFLDLRNYKKLILPFFLQGILPVILFFAYTKLTDTHTDRTTEPYGFLYFPANIESVFISTLPPFRHFLSQIYKIKQQNWEGIAYVGIVSLAVFLYLPVFLILHRKKLKAHFQSHVNSKTLLLIGMSSIVLLLFSMTYPFRWNLEWLLDYLLIVKQFRAPGRFAWVFYFFATIFSTILISKYFLRNTKENIRLFFCSIILALFIVEGIPYHLMLKKYLFVKNSFNYEYTDTELKEIISFMNKRKAQAIIPVPFFHIGTDYYTLIGTDKIKRAAFIVSFHTKTPLMAGFTPRTSISESTKLMGILGSDLLEKDLKADLKSHQNFYILNSKENLLEDENEFLSKGHIVYETPGYLLKEVSFEELFFDGAPNKIAFFEKHRNQLVRNDKFFLNDSSYFKFIDFDSLPNKVFSGEIKETHLIYKIPSNSLEKNKRYEINFLYELQNDQDINNEVIIVQKTQGTDSVISERNISSMPNIGKGVTIALLSFKAEHPENEYLIYLKGRNDSKKTFAIDNFMIRRKDVDVYRKVFLKDCTDSVLILNNFILQHTCR